MALVVLVARMTPVHAEDPARLLSGSAQSAALPGARVEELLSLARAMSPAVAAAALEAAASRARVDAAGRLPDPKLAAEFRDIGRQRDSFLPEDLARVEYTIEQDFPLWGKRGLEQRVARARAGAALETQRATEQDVAAQIKALFAAYYAGFESTRLTRELEGAIATLADVSHGRYANGQGEQADVIRAEAEITRLRGERLRFDTETRQAAARLNALVDRPADAPLAPPSGLRSIPEAARALPTLLERAARDNPSLGAARADIDVAEGDRALVDRSWYPDVTLGVTFQQFVDQTGRSPGYEAMIGTSIPLQWGLREARQREAVANVAAARHRRDALDASLRGDLAAAFWGLDGARQQAALLSDVQLPLAQLAFAAALRAYEHGRGDIGTVLDAEREVIETMLQRLARDVEQQTRLAEIERLIGGEL